ncbi:hypothetical protein ASPBRDRAFT_479301 [Aspergillus brasiliensis CBS 101740]|uniref:Uncharacterized protein n=1 Tax=Aspergillus brasiliensis (strain CBS 101740 / IMI 381727 / IBT 21946) TaxID=767769 RepID=A0A1L9UTW8_ASPBC|nr:hypothetical protein ASPBRDRAFT_479301 [Aspergillus brasiliensis CBS 101740]
MNLCFNLCRRTITMTSYHLFFTSFLFLSFLISYILHDLISSLLVKENSDLGTCPKYEIRELVNTRAYPHSHNPIFAKYISLKVGRSRHCSR